MSRSHRTALLVAMTSVLAIPITARATWSIIIIDIETKEIAVGSATCLTNFDLEEGLPVVAVDVGAGCAQSLVDVGANNRMTILEEMLKGTDPDDILEILEAQDGQHDSRQYGLADTLGRITTFTGDNAGEWAGGVVGRVGSLAYSIQGNVLTGEPVVQMAEDAVINTPGDLPAKLMAAMEAARSMGGDGRCSCAPFDPTGCGSPPPEFDKSAHVGFMFVTRTGDTDGVCNGAAGCANGDYFMNFNVPNQQSNDPDPVFQLQDMFDAWRMDQIGRPDAVHSISSTSVSGFLADGNGQATVSFTVRDWQDSPVIDEDLVITVAHDETGDQTTTIGPVMSLGNGDYEFTVTGSDQVGVDTYRITVDDGVRPVILLPMPRIASARVEDLDLDGDVDKADQAALVACMDGPDTSPVDECASVDVDADGSVTLADYGQLMNAFTAEPCVVLDVGPSLFGNAGLFCETSLELFADIWADPQPTYQWFLDGELLPGETNPTFTVESVCDDDEGFMTLLVTNTCGSILSNPLEVRVAPSPCPCP